MCSPIALETARVELLKELESTYPQASGACFVLSIVLDPAIRKAVVGDLIEEYQTFILPTVGSRRAKLWLWSQASRSAASFLGRRVWRLGASILAWNALSATVRRLIG